MAKTHPYFKFYCSEWNDGDITLEDFETQGVFIGLCSLYWSRECKLLKKTIDKRFRNNLKNILTLEEEGIIKILGSGFVKISFLDEQWVSKDGRASTSRLNGSKGGRPKKPNKPNDNPEEPKHEPNGTQYIGEDSRVDKSIEEENQVKPKPDAFSKFFDSYPKPFSFLCVYTKQNFYEQVAKADGEEPILMAVEMFAEYCKSSQMQVQHIPKAQNWLNDQSWRTNWFEERNKAKSSSKGLSNSAPSVIKKGDKF